VLQIQIRTYILKSAPVFFHLSLKSLRKFQAFSSFEGSLILFACAEFVSQSTVLVGLACHLHYFMFHEPEARSG